MRQSIQHSSGLRVKTNGIKRFLIPLFTEHHCNTKEAGDGTGAESLSILSLFSVSRATKSRARGSNLPLTTSTERALKGIGKAKPILRWIIRSGRLHDDGGPYSFQNYELCLTLCVSPSHVLGYDIARRNFMGMYFVCIVDSVGH